MFPETMQTSRLTFRPIGPADAGPIFDGYAQDPVVSRFLTWRPHAEIGETEAYVARAMAALSSRTYVLAGRDDGRVLGAFDLVRAVPWHISYGYVLARAEWGKGLMTEALAEAARWALGQSDVWRFGGVCDVENGASARVMEKVGLSREGILRRWAMHPNVSAAPRDCFSYAVVR